MAEQPASASTSSVASWFHLACHPATVKRALITALIVGCILIAINDGPAIVRGELDRARIIQMSSHGPCALHRFDSIQRFHPP
jgi:hypothetical protein